MKKMITKLSTLILLIVLTTGCSKEVNYTNVIPADAYVVGSADLVALVEKSGLLTESSEAKQLILGVLENNTSADIYKQAEKVLTSPKESGLDLEKRIYMFTSTDFIYPVWVLKVSDKGKLNTTLSLFSKEKLCSSVNSAAGFNYVTIEGSQIFAYNETSAIFANSIDTSNMQDLESKIGKLMNQDASNSIESNVAFGKLTKEHGDINFMASLAALPEIYSQQLKTSTGLPNVDLKDVTALGELDFKKGKIELKFNYFTENKEIEALMKRQAQVSKTLSRQFAEYFPESTLAFASVGANGKAMYSLILDNEDLKSFIPSADSPAAKSIFESIDGDISIGITGVNMTTSSSFIAYAAIDNKDILNELYQNKESILSPGQSVEKIGDNEFLFKMGSLKVYYGIDNKTMYATNDMKLKSNLCKEIKPSIKNAAYFEDMKGKNFFLVLNIAEILDLSMVKMVVGFGGQEYQMYYNLASKFDYLEMSNTMENVSEMSLILKDRETNALKQIVDFARQFIGL